MSARDPLPVLPSTTQPSTLPPATVLLLSGSARAASYNTRLLRELAARMACLPCDARHGARLRVDLLEPAGLDLPLFNEDLESDPVVLARVAALHGRLARAQGLLVASPDYNGQPPPLLTNLLSWVSRLPRLDSAWHNPFTDLPVLLCCASTGWGGGAAALPSLRALFGTLGALVIGDTVCVPQAAQAWTDDGYAFDPFFDEQVDDALLRLMRLANLQQRSGAPALPTL